MLNKVVGGFYHVMDHPRILSESVQTCDSEFAERVRQVLESLTHYCQELELLESTKALKDLHRRSLLPQYYDQLKLEMSFVRRVIENEATD